MSKGYFKLIPAVYLVVRDKSRILLLQRANTGYEDGKLSLPAGHVDGDETLEQAMAREAQEEINIVINPSDLQLVHVQHRRSGPRDLSDERVDFYFECHKWQGTPTNNEPDKCDALVWTPIDELPANTIAHVRTAITAINNSQLSTNVGWENNAQAK